MATPEEQQKVCDLINDHRNKYRAEPLKLHSKLNASATSHSDDMAKHGRMSHTGSDGSSPFDRITAAGYKQTYAGECVAWNQQDAEAVVMAWMEDPPHRRILVDPNYKHVGVGETNLYWTADFAAGDVDDEPPPPLKPGDFDLW